MLLVMGADHAGFLLKEELKKAFAQGPGVLDCTPKLKKGDDYPDAAKTVCALVVKQEALGVLVCGSGLGMSIAANKVKGVRAVLCRTVEDAMIGRSHNDANILCLGGRITKPAVAKKIVKAFLETSFSGRTKAGARHGRRVGKLATMERARSASFGRKR